MDKRTEEQGIESRRKIYDFLIEFITKNGYSPSIREICSGTNIKSTSTVHHHLLVLEKMGLIRTKMNKSRTISVVGYKFVKVRKCGR